MQRQDFAFDLPSELIAQAPLPERASSRLMVLSGATGAISHRQFTDILDLINGDDLLVFNNTRVLAARVYAVKETGGRVEILLERMLADGSALAQIRSSKSPKPNTTLFVAPDEHSTPSELSLRVIGRQESFFVIEPLRGDWSAILDNFGHMPLPPYIERADTPEDRERYQTLFAKKEGAVAAPTAGLHFDAQLLANLTARGIRFTELTLHVAAGTFQPMRVDDLADHTMHSEFIDVGQDVVDAVAACRERGGRVVAVGTTAVRSLETAAQTGQLAPFHGDSDIFLYPGKTFHVVDAMITNFHLPESTLIMLVAAFAGHEHVLNGYRQAVENRYRFFSYGDAMFITPTAAALRDRGNVGEI